MVLNKLECGIGIAVLICGVVFMYLAYFIYYKEYLTYFSGGQSTLSDAQNLFALVVPLVVILIGISIIYDCFRPVKLKPLPPPPPPT